jgi:hypothetical protein
MLNRFAAFVGLLLLCAGCGGEAEKPEIPEVKIPDSFALATEPAGAETPVQLRASGKIGEATVVGRVGGDRVVFVENRAVFTLVDPSLDPCHEDEGCPSPWDYCCNDPEDLKSKSVTVELHQDGKILKSSIQGFKGLDHLKTVVAVGHLKRDEAGNQVLIATGLHVRP